MVKGLRKYIDYLSNNPENYWFKRKAFGWGWIPVRWQGWLFLIIWLGLFVQIYSLVENQANSASDAVIGMIFPAILLVILLFLVCYGTGEKPRWSWGIK